MKLKRLRSLWRTIPIFGVALLLLYALFSILTYKVSAAPTAPNDTAVFINEIHYDNDGTDAGEAIEVAGPAGTDLTNWSIVLYNGSGGVTYDINLLSGTIPDSAKWMRYPFLDLPYKRTSKWFT